jgi:hypothetical protein
LTGLLSFDKLLNLTRDKAITWSFGPVQCGRAASRHQHQLAKGGFTDQADGLRIFTDLDRGVEWCENQILHAPNGERREKPGRIFAAIVLQAMRDVAYGAVRVRGGRVPDAYRR